MNATQRNTESASRQPQHEIPAHRWTYEPHVSIADGFPVPKKPSGRSEPAEWREFYHSCKPAKVVLQHIASSYAQFLDEREVELLGRALYMHPRYEPSWSPSRTKMPHGKGMCLSYTDGDGKLRKFHLSSLGMSPFGWSLNNAASTVATKIKNTLGVIECNLKVRPVLENFIRIHDTYTGADTIVETKRYTGSLFERFVDYYLRECQRSRVSREVDLSHGIVAQGA